MITDKCNATNNSVLTTLLGSLGTITTMVVSYFLEVLKEVQIKMICFIILLLFYQLLHQHQVQINKDPFNKQPRQPKRGL